PPVVDHLEAQPGAWNGEEDQRMARPRPPEARRTDLDAGGCEPRPVERVVLHHEEALIERQAAGHLAPRLQPARGTGTVLVIVETPVLEPGQPVPPALPGRDLDPDRQRMNEQPDRPVDPRDLGLPPRRRDAEEDVA